MENETIFVDGFITNDIPDTEPEWVLGEGAMHVEKLAQWLEANKKYASEKGWIGFKILRSKGGNRYAKLDNYSFKKKENPTPEMVKEARENLANQTVEEIENNYPQEVPQEIPF